MGIVSDRDVVELYYPYRERRSGEPKPSIYSQRNKSEEGYSFFVWQSKLSKLLTIHYTTQASVSKSREGLRGAFEAAEVFVRGKSAEASIKSGSCLRRLNAQALKNGSWTEEDVETLSEWVMANRGGAIGEVQKNSNQGRLRWAILESLALAPDDRLRQMLCELVADHQLDPWLLNGVPVVIRMVDMGGARQQAIKAMRSHLKHIQHHEQRYREHVSECGVGELVMTFGSFADTCDFDLVGAFALGNWRLKVRVNAFDSLRRMTQRHQASKKTDAFFEENREKLRQLGQFLAWNFRTSEDDGALFLSWLCLILSRIGPEAEWIGPILQEYPRHVKRVRYELKQARARLKGAKKPVLERLERLENLVR
jgi:hypothetical protein